MNKFGKVFLTIALAALCCPNTSAQEPSPAGETSGRASFPEDAPVLRSEGAPRLYYIRNIDIHGVKYLNPEILKSSAGLIAGDSIYLPSDFISNAITRLWSQRFFSDVKIGAEIEGDSLDLQVFLKERPRVLNWDFEGVSKGKKKDLLEKLKLRRGSELSDYVIDKNIKLIKAYWAEKGFRNAEVDVRIDNDSIRPQAVRVTFLIDKKDKVKIGKINFSGNEQFADKRLRRTFKKTHQKSINFLRSTKLNESDFEDDKELLIDFYNARGYRNATIVRDSIYPIDSKRLGIDIELSEGNKYYIRNVSWVGNSVYETEELQRML
ncbi:MAG: outer membrane protein assembly factor BamA, partial [Alistipes sp.]|nr:outer membrane protein assembly factor BamA [Alistipes sp.]